MTKVYFCNFFPSEKLKVWPACTKQKKKDLEISKENVSSPFQTEEEFISVVENVTSQVQDKMCISNTDKFYRMLAKIGITKILSLKT